MRLAFLLAIGLAACGSGGSGPALECPDDPSRCPGMVQIRWTMLNGDFEGFNETCGGVGADEMELSITGPSTHVTRYPCSNYSTYFYDPLPGRYTVVARLIDKNPTLMTEEAITAGGTVLEFDYPGPEVSLDVPESDFLRSYDGTYYFRIKWGGSPMCSDAQPPVVRQVLRLERDGAPLAGVTDVGDPIDGSASGACRDFAGNFPQRVMPLPWGPATMTISGLDEAGVERYRGTFDTFVGAGDNPEMHFDVIDLVDASPDGGGTPDGGTDAP